MKTPCLLTLTLLLSLPLPTRAADGPAAAVTLGDFAGPKATLLAIDDYSLPLRSGLCYYLSKPKVRAEPVLTPSRDNPHATDVLGTCFYGSVLQEQGKFRMWYYGLGLKDNPEHLTDIKSIYREGPVCYAESTDGLHWTKPNLGQVTQHGSSDNNAIALPAAETEGPFVIRDDSDPDPARRYKMVYENTSAPRPTVDTAASPDGIHWHGVGTAARELEPSSFYKFNGLYYIGAQNTAFVSEGGHKGGRQGFIWVSPDFVHWLPESGEAFLLPEPANPNDRGHDRSYLQVHLGVGAVSYGNALVGLYCQWHALPNAGDWFGKGTTYGDLGLVVSNDGQHFREPVRGHVFFHRHDSAPNLPTDIRAEEVLQQAGNGILNVGDETWIYHGRWMNAEKLTDFYIEIALATLPRDRWGAIGLAPHVAEGSVWSAPLTLTQAGGKISLNAQGVQGMRVEIADDRFGLIPEFSGENAGTATGGDGLACGVTWSKGNLDTLAGKKIRLRIHLKNGGPTEPRLFAVYVAAQ